jgi:hypothetical protein
MVIVLVAVGIPLLLILCCVGTFVVAPLVGLGIFESQKTTSDRLVSVAGHWSNGTGYVQLAVAASSGRLTLRFTDPSGTCLGRVSPPSHDEYAVQFDQVPCGPAEQPITSASGQITLNPQGDELTLTVPGHTDIVLYDHSY